MGEPFDAVFCSAPGCLAPVPAEGSGYCRTHQLPPPPQVYACYQTARGAYMGRMMPWSELAAWLPRQKRAVQVYRGASGPAREEVIGGVEWCTRTHECGNERPHWHWWHEPAPEAR